MVRRYLVISCKRTFFVFLMICLGCSAQLAPTELAQRIERQLRVSYNVPASVKVVISPPRASEFPNYDAVTVTFDGDGKKQHLEFLLSKDHPLADIHPWATHAAVDSNCLAAQNGGAYGDFADYIHANRQVVNSEKGLENQFAALDRNTMTGAGKF